MFGPLFPNSKMASASLGTVKKVAAQEQATQNTDSDRRTLQDCQELPLSYVPHLLNEASVLKPYNYDCTVFWHDVDLGSQNSYPKIANMNWMPSREVWRHRILKAQAMKWQVRSVHLAVTARWSCNLQPLSSSITRQIGVHLISLELHAGNHCSSADCDIDVLLYIHTIELYRF